MTDYKGIKINDDVIIVAKGYTSEELSKDPDMIPQGYVVDKGNKKMLETAVNWAKCVKYDNSIKTYSERLQKAITIPGEILEYKNGNFKIILQESASWSSQGGKLSFWNCIIEAPDSRKFLIGINSELLLHLIKSNTLVNGECQSKVWLGRIKGSQVGAFTENMDEFKQAKLDASTRAQKKTVKYKPGDVVTTLTSKDVYLGEFYSYGKIVDFADLAWHSSLRHLSNYGHEKEIVIYDKPVKCFGYVYKDTDTDLIEKATKDHCSVEFKKTKAAKHIYSHCSANALENAISVIDNFKDQYKEYLKQNCEKYSDYSYGYYSALDRVLNNLLITSKSSLDYQTLGEAVDIARKYLSEYFDNINYNYRGQGQPDANLFYKIVFERDLTPEQKQLLAEDAGLEYFSIYR